MDKETAKRFDDISRILERMAVPIPAIPAIPAIPSIPAIPPMGVFHSGDHDILTRLEENVGINFKQVKDAIKELTDGTKSQIEDHEKRIRENEKNITKIMTWGTALIIFMGVVEFFVNKFVFR